jgi:hypothetical protein
MDDFYDLAVAWDWEHDAEFISRLKSTSVRCGLALYSVSHDNVALTLDLLRAHRISFRSFLDRASDTDERFLPLAQAIRLSGSIPINPHEALRHAADKATMHLEFLTSGITVPYTLIISPFNERREIELSLTDLSRLGRPFIIKPANTTGGGIGVILGAETLKDVIESRQHHKNDKYLLQEKILPGDLDGRVGWFRVFGVFGAIIPCWWHPETHRYDPVSDDDIRRFELRPLTEITSTIQKVCGLDFFSTEIAATGRGRFVVVDYVNETCDMRLQSQHEDGVPDLVVMKICETIANHLKSLAMQ